MKSIPLALMILSFAGFFSGLGMEIDHLWPHLADCYGACPIRTGRDAELVMCGAGLAVGASMAVAGYIGLKRACG